MLEIGTKIYLVHKSNDEEGDKKEQLRCRFVDREDDESILVDYPINEVTEKQQLFLLEGERFLATFIGKDGAVYEFDTEIIARKRTNVPMLQLEDPGKEHYRRIQRRDYVRVEAVLDVVVHPLHREKVPFQTVLVDISGGGCKIVWPKEKDVSLGENYRLELVLPLKPKEERIEIIGEVVRVNAPQTDSDKKRVSFKFIEISEGDRQKIIKFCFDRQLVMRKTKDL